MFFEKHENFLVEIFSLRHHRAFRGFSKKHPHSTVQITESVLVSNLMNEALKILEGFRRGDPSRTEFLVLPDEARVMLQNGGVAVVLNKDNGDGTYYTEIIFEGFTLKCSAVEKV